MLRTNSVTTDYFQIRNPRSSRYQPGWLRDIAAGNFPTSVSCPTVEVYNVRDTDRALLKEMHRLYQLDRWETMQFQHRNDFQQPCNRFVSTADLAVRLDSKFKMRPLDNGISGSRN